MIIVENGANTNIEREKSPYFMLHTMRSNDGEQHSKMKNRRLYQQNLSKCANFVYLAETKHIRHSQAIE